MRWLFPLATGICLLALPAFGQDRSASLTGTAKDILGEALDRATAELRSDTSPEKIFQAKADSKGLFVLSALPPDEYTLKLRVPGFKVLTVKSIDVLEGEQKILPPLELGVGLPCADGSANEDYLRPLPEEGREGDLVGSIRSKSKGNPPVSGADVSLMCDGGKVCAATKTDSGGGFLLKAVPPGHYSIRINRTGFHEADKFAYVVAEGFESVYSAIFVERCSSGKCNPGLRPKKLGTCY